VGFSFSQLSQQYVDQSVTGALLPEAIRQLPEAVALWDESIERSREDYQRLLRLLEDEESDLAPRERLRAMRSAARTVLPEGFETKILCSANARSLRHFLATRGSIEGDEEMRQVSALLLKALDPEAPAVFEDFSLEWLSDGLPVVRHRAQSG
jgi:thymidylate synthase (FAD)